MRVIQVAIGFYPSQIWGGFPSVVASFSKGLIQRGHQVTILSSNILDYRKPMKPDTFEGEWDGIPVVYLKAHWRGRRSDSMGFIWMPALWRYRHLVRDADVVHIHGYRTFMFVGAGLLAQRYKVPYLIQPHGSLPPLFGRVRLKRLFDYSIGPYILRRAAAGIALSDSEIADFSKYGVLAGKISQIMNPWDPAVCPQLPDGRAFRQRFGIPPDKKIALFLSRIHKKKGLDLLIEAMANLDVHDVLLCIVGPDDGFESTAREMISRLGLEDCTLFTGPLYDREKFEAYRAADLYVLPTRGVEGLPMTIVEALYCGTPVIVTRTTEIAELVDGRAGVAVDYDAEQLANAITRLLNDPDLREAFGREGQTLVAENFDLETVVDHLLETYNICAARPKADRA
jgi:glycosyltransferase involved in cell wall biosynthesis